MTRRITPKDGADAIAMLGQAKTADELRTGDVTTMVAADVAKARVQDREDAIKAKQTSALRDDKPEFRVVVNEDAIKAKQNGDRKSARTAAVAAANAPAKKATGTSRAQKVAAPAAPVAKRGTTDKPGKTSGAPSKAARVRELLDQGKTVNEVAKALDDVTWSYAWDVAAIWEKATGKKVIPSHMPAKAKTARAPRTSKGSAFNPDQLVVAK